jgi:Ran GTPase-activating protein (RanGAP) involved in mRNA processing and transport
MHNLSSVNFINHLYMFRAYLQSTIRRYTLWIQQWGLNILLGDCLLSCSGQQTVIRCLTKYPEDKLRTKLVFLYTNISRCTVNKT